jgi:hypothetical protein
MKEKTHRFEKQDIVKCDDRGRATLGTEFAGKQVLVWVAPTPGLEETEPLDDDLHNIAAKMATWASEQGIDWYDIQPRTGIVEDTDGEKHQSPYGVNNQ